MVTVCVNVIVIFYRYLWNTEEEKWKWMAMIAFKHPENIDDSVSLTE